MGDSTTVVAVILVFLGAVSGFGATMMLLNDKAFLAMLPAVLALALCALALAVGGDARD